MTWKKWQTIRIKIGFNINESLDWSPVDRVILLFASLSISISFGFVLIYCFAFAAILHTLLKSSPSKQPDQAKPIALCTIKKFMVNRREMNLHLYKINYYRWMLCACSFMRVLSVTEAYSLGIFQVSIIFIWV